MIGQRGHVSHHLGSLCECHRVNICVHLYAKEVILMLKLGRL